MLAARNLDVRHGHEATSPRDVMALVEAGFGLAVIPRSDAIPATDHQGGGQRHRFAPQRVSLWRRRSRAHGAVASALLKLVRAADWSRHAS